MDDIVDVNDNKWKPDVLVVGPGGVKGFVELGALLKLEDDGYLKNVKTFTGCSAGAAICLLLVAGYNVTEIIQMCWKINLLKDVTDLNFDDIKDRAGLISNKTVENLLSQKIVEKFGMQLSLRQLYMATGKKLTIVTYNISDQRTEYFNKDTEPNISCVNAVMMSMAVPLLIQSRRYKGRDYIDGAIGNPYPIDIHDDGHDIILGLYITEGKSNDNGLIRKAYKMLHASMGELRTRIINNASEKCYNLELKSAIMDTTGLTVKSQYKKDMISSGYDSAKIFIEKIKNPEKYKVLLDVNEEIPIINTTLPQTVNVNSDLNSHTMMTNSHVNSDLNAHTAIQNDLDDILNNTSCLSNENSEIITIPITPHIRKTLKCINKRKLNRKL